MQQIKNSLKKKSKKFFLQFYWIRFIKLIKNLNKCLKNFLFFLKKNNLRDKFIDIFVEKTFFHSQPTYKIDF